MLSAWGLVIDLGLSHAGLPVPLRIGILQIIYLQLLLQPTMRIDQIWLVEWLSLIKPISVLSSFDVRVQILLSFPTSLIKQLGIGLEPACNRLFAVLLAHAVVEFAIRNVQLDVGVGLGSVLRVEVGLSEGGAPFLVERWMRN